jgi:hypothetical protein
VTDFWAVFTAAFGDLRELAAMSQHFLIKNSRCGNRRFSSVFLPDKASLSDGFSKQIHWFCSTNPLKSFNEINGIVERNQWICFLKLTF